MTSWKKIITSGSNAELSSLIISNIPSADTGQSVLTYDPTSGRIYKTGSYIPAGTVATASLALSGGSDANEFYVNNDCFISGGLVVSGNFTPAGGVTITDTSVDNFINNTTFNGTVDIAGVTQLGTSSDNTIIHEITGNLSISASHGISFTGSANTVGFHGTASHAISSSQTVSSSYALTASHALNVISDTPVAGFPYAGSDKLNNDPAQAVITGSLFLSGSGHITASGGIVISKSSRFNSGVNVLGNLNIGRLQISSSKELSTYFQQSFNGTSTHLFKNKKGDKLTNLFINLEVGSPEAIGGIIFSNQLSKIKSFITNEKSTGIITFSGSGEEFSSLSKTAGMVSFKKGITGNTTFKNDIIVEGTINSTQITATSFTGSLKGTATNAVFATHANNINLTSNSELGNSVFIPFSITSTNNSPLYTDDDLTYIPYSNLLNTTSSQAVSASYSLSSSQSTSASYSISSSQAVSASYALSSSQTISASYAVSASQTVSASFSISASQATSASYSISSSQATSASSSTTASYALSIAEGLGGGGGLWHDGETYWTSSIQPSGAPTKIGIGREPTLYSLEVSGTMAATQDVIAFMGSDKRLKDNIKPINDPIGKIKQIGGYTFDWNNNQNVYKGNDVGVIAQEIEKVLPSLVQDREDGYKGVKYDKIVALLIEAIKDQQKQIDELKKLI